MIYGQLEGLLPDGFIEGWAFDAEAPERSVGIEVRDAKGDAIGAGLAHLFRSDLADAQVGLGWCAFSLRPSVPLDLANQNLLSLYERATGRQLHANFKAPILQRSAPSLAAHGVAGLDPFSCGAIADLRACEALFDRQLQSVGARAFTRLAYLYVLNRTADPESLALNAALLERAALTPLRLLELLADSAEAHLEPRRFASPKAPDFPFVGAAHVR